MTDIAIVAAVRTPIGSFRGAFAPLSAVDLGAAVVRGLLERCQLPAAAVDELIFGQVLTAGCGQNPARQTALRAGLPVDTPAVTVNLVCGSGLKAVQQAVQAIRCGDAGIVIAGGQESMSNAPYLMHGARDGLRFGHASLQDSMIQDGLWDAFNDYHMGITAENLADAFDISRERQDAFAASSQRKAAAAIAAGRFREEIVPVSVPQGKKPPRVVTDDEQPRPETSEQQLAQLRPAFRAWAAGAGAHCQLSGRRGRPIGDGHWPGERLPPGAASRRLDAGRGGPYRSQRGFCRPGAGRRSAA